MPAYVVALGSVPMVDEMPVAGNGVTSLGSTLSELPQPTRVKTSVVSLPGIGVPAPYRTGVRLEPELVTAVAIVNAEATNTPVPAEVLTRSIRWSVGRGILSRQLVGRVTLAEMRVG